MIDQPIGHVYDCLILEILEEPRPDADIVCTIPFTTRVMIDESESTDDFYKVFTSIGIEGFCDKRFISIE